MTGEQGQHQNLLGAYVNRIPSPQIIWEELRRALVRQSASEQTAIEVMRVFMRLEQLEGGGCYRIRRVIE